MRAYVVAGILSALTILTQPYTVSAQNIDQNCNVPDPPGQMDWCLEHDDVFNEGAQCGAEIIADRKAPPGWTRIMNEKIAGNTFKRPEMMRVAIEAYRQGYERQAVEIALCCQRHNPDYNAMRDQCWMQIEGWLRSKK